MTKLAFQVGRVSIEPVADLELRIGLLLIVECLGNLVTEATLLDDLANQPLITVLEVVLRLRPSNRALSRLKMTRIDGNVSEGRAVVHLLILLLHRPCIAQVHIVLNTGAVERIRIIVKQDLRAEAVQLLLSLLVFGCGSLLASDGCAESAPVRDDLRDATILGCVLFGSLLG